MPSGNMPGRRSSLVTRTPLPRIDYRSCPVYQVPTVSLEYDVSSFSFFQRQSVQEFLGFFSCTIAERTAFGVRQAVQQDAYIGYVYSNPQGLSGVVITDHEYPQRVAFHLINKILDDFMSNYSRTNWMSRDPSPFKSSQSALREPSSGPFPAFGGWFGGNNTSSPTPSQYPFPVLKDLLVKYQDPHEADNILKIQKELDETKVVLHKTIESLLDRGEKLDNLVDKSERLSGQSKSFYKVAKKTNACCWLQ